jgi:hypothetical protein
VLLCHSTEVQQQPVTPQHGPLPNDDYAPGTHTPQVQKSRCQTPTTHTKISQVISVKHVQHSLRDSHQDAADIKKIPNRYQRLITVTTVHYWMFGKGHNILWANYNTASVDAWLET